MNYSHDYAFGGTFSTATVLRALCRLPESLRQNIDATILWELDGRPWNPAKLSALSPGAHQLKVRQTGAIPACVSARVAWREKDANAQAHPSSQIAISRSYTLYSESKQNDLHIGNIVMVELELNLLNAQEYLRVSDPLLAGIDTNVTPNSTMWDSEKHKTTMEFFLRRVPAGIFKIRYPIRLLYAGHFTALPALAEPMYAPQFKATTHTDTITILP